MSTVLDVVDVVQLLKMQVRVRVRVRVRATVTGED
jgi:hypothetical protein